MAIRCLISADYKTSDGRIIDAYVIGTSYSATFWEPGYFEEDENEPLKMKWKDSQEELSEDEFLRSQEEVFEYVMDNGTWEDASDDLF